MVKLYRKIPKSQPWYLGQIFTDWLIKCSDRHIFSNWYNVFHFSLLFNPAIYRMGIHQITYVLDCEEQDGSHPNFYSIANCLKLPYISELVNLNYIFKAPFIIGLKAIIMGNSFQFHDGVHFKILPTLV